MSQQIFECAIPHNKEMPEYWGKIKAYDAQDAAADYAKSYDSEGDYTIIKRGSAEVWVRDSSGAVTMWEIEAYSDPTYTAIQITQSDAGSERG